MIRSYNERVRKSSFGGGKLVRSFNASNDEIIDGGLHFFFLFFQFNSIIVASQIKVSGHADVVVLIVVGSDVLDLEVEFDGRVVN